MQKSFRVFHPSELEETLKLFFGMFIPFAVLSV